MHFAASYQSRCAMFNPGNIFGYVITTYKCNINLCRVIVYFDSFTKINKNTPESVLYKISNFLSSKIYSIVTNVGILVSH